MKTLVTKGEYAKLKGRAPSAVSNWIAEGKITSDALDGEGNRARVWVERADADLGRNLDPGQQAAQDIPVAPSIVAPVVEGNGGAEIIEFRSPAANRAANEDEDIRRRRKADADKAEHDAEAARRRNAVDEGRWIAADGARREWARELAKIISDTETFLTNGMARTIAEKYQLDWKELSVELRRLYREHRTVVADGAGEERVTIERALEAAE